MRFLHRRSTKGVAAVATVFATAAFVVQLGMPSAFAVTAPTAVASFFPVHDAAAADTTFFHDNVAPAAATDDTQMAVLSDLPNGVNSAAHLVAVTGHTSTAPAVQGATQVSWYWCDAGLVPPTCPSANVIGTATTKTTALKTPGYTGGSIDDAWSITWNIPASLDGLTKDIVVEGCNGTPDATFSNCTNDVVPTLLDDSGTGNNPQTSSGVITAPTNGSAVAQAVSQTLKASTSPELTAVGFGFNGPAGSGDAADPARGGSDVDSKGGSTDFGIYNALTPATTTATAKTWSVTVPSADLPTNNEYALTLWSTITANMNFTGTGAAVAGGATSFVLCGSPSTCGATEALALDRIYTVLEPGTPGAAASVALKQTSDVTADPTCATGASSIFTGAGSTVNLTGCVFDPFGAAVGSEGVFWSLTNTSPATGAFVGTPLLVTAANGQAKASISSTAAAAGGSTVVTFCDDHDKNAVCDGAGTTTTFTITWSTVAGAHARKVSLSLRDALTARGRVTVPDGTAACASSVPVKVQKRVGGSWKTLKSVKTSGTGTYKAHLANKHGKYRALAPRVTKGTDVCKRAVSPTRSH